MRVTPGRMAALIETNLGDRTEMHSSEMLIDSIDELLAFRSLPAAAQVGPYRITREDGRTTNDWIELPSFRIECIPRREAR